MGGGRDAGSKSWGIREMADEFVDDDNNDGLRLDDVGDGGGEGFGREVIIFVAGRRSLLAWDFFPLSNAPRRRIAPTGTSTYSNVAIVDAQGTNGTATENLLIKTRLSLNLINTQKNIMISSQVKRDG